ncbi:ABC transporter ATP-binding protein [Methanospirillum lacunae]|uniref:ABC transporter ATP-binding protein n=1 Tax=Methanospirillum lacunae TaxID=668570 RepID=A0A2V2N5F8_9EURY|nr:ABC transporter ATP-binding protein [Methanospirillum lacunae]PWR73745.1 ABC transporter ATP-binding protein [Methanospirillum lacunae]
MTPIIQTTNLKKTYGDVTAVNSITLSVEKGALFGLLGPNGSGKTTMIKMLTGQIRQTSGSALVLGREVAAEPIWVRQQVGILPEQETPPSFLTALEYLDLVGSIRNLPDITSRADWWFDFLDFADKKNVLCKDLSRGTRQKLMLAQAFIHQPELAFIDEPLINFDPVMQRVVKDFFVEYVKTGNTLFISTHILSIAEEICSGFAILHKGNLLKTGSPQELSEEGISLDDYFLRLVGRNKDA